MRLAPAAAQTRRGFIIIIVSLGKGANKQMGALARRRLHLSWARSLGLALASLGAHFEWLAPRRAI